jgi:hypothetical protein
VMGNELSHFFCDGEDPKALPPSPDDFAEAWGSPTFPPAVINAERNAELMRSASPVRMNAIVAIKHACAEALKANQLGPGEASVYSSVVDPVSVLALIEIMENRISEEEISALHHLIEEMACYIRTNASSPEADTLLRRARQVVAITGTADYTSR